MAENASAALAAASFGVGGLDNRAAREVTAVLTDLRADAGDF